MAIEQGIHTGNGFHEKIESVNYANQAGTANKANILYRNMVSVNANTVTITEQGLYMFVILADDILGMHHYTSMLYYAENTDLIYERYGSVSGYINTQFAYVTCTANGIVTSKAYAIADNTAEEITSQIVGYVRIQQGS